MSHPSRWKDLDKLITLLQTQTEDDGYFIYLKAGDHGDPYDLQPLVDASKTNGGLNISPGQKPTGGAVSKKAL